MTLDARGCQKALARQIVEQAADSGLALKATQETLDAAVAQQFQAALHTAGEGAALPSSETEEAQPGRGEIRRHWPRAAPQGRAQPDAWAQVRALGMGEAERHLNGAVSSAQRSYSASRDQEVKQFAHAVRAPWGSETGVPWVLEMAFREDAARVRVGHAPENLAVLRHMALNLLRQEPTAQVGIHNKRLKAGWDEAYLATLVFGHTF